MAKPKLCDDGRTVTVRVPLSIRKRGGRRLVVAPDGAELCAAPVLRHVDNAMVKAIARAFRWRDMLESGEITTIREIAAAEKINETYVGRVLRLTLLAPDIVDAVLTGRQSPNMQLDIILQRFSLDWRSQQKELGGGPGASHLDPSLPAKMGSKDSRISNVCFSTRGPVPGLAPSENIEVVTTNNSAFVDLSDLVEQHVFGISR
jgi:hypothetical protein